MNSIEIYRKLVSSLDSLSSMGSRYQIVTPLGENKKKATELLTHFFSRSCPPPYLVTSMGDGDIWITWKTTEDKEFSVVIDEDGTYRVYCDPYIDLFIPLLNTAVWFIAHQKEFKTDDTLLEARISE